MTRYYALVRRVILETQEVFVSCEDGQGEEELTAVFLFKDGAGVIIRASEEYDTEHEADFQVLKVWKE